MRRKKKNNKKNSEKKFSLHLSPETKKNIWAIAFIFLGIFLTLSLLSLGGKIGDFLKDGLFFLFGKVGAPFFILLFFTQAISFFLSSKKSPYLSILLGGFFLFLSLISLFSLFSSSLGGKIGEILVILPLKLLGKAGSFVFFLAGFLISFCILFNLPLFKIIFEKIFRKEKKEEEKVEKEKIIKEGKVNLKIKEIFPKKEIKEKIETSISKIFKEKEEEKPKIRYKYLPLNLLEKEEENPMAGDIKINAQIIKRTLQNFGIEVEMGEINIGPTVTQYTLKPAEGVKLSKILSLQNDLSLSLAAHPIRIEAPIPGKSLVGVEVPNRKRAIVRLRSLLSSSKFFSLPPLGFPLGKDVIGNPVFADLGSMPHLLVAGATGTGKTVFLNSLIVSLLWRNSPETLRFILIDPKRVEFHFYAPLPHLLCPPVVHHSKVIPVLKWLIEEMERRFEILREVGERDIQSYSKRRKKEKSLKPMPYIILVIDELADIMAAKGKEFEHLIVRLTQMARAVGIHLVLATQRPSVEVLTGLIKANITARVAFQVASQIDSRTILDTVGAERLLGRGDMLFLSGEAARPKRIQAPFVSSQEIIKVVEYIKETEKKAQEEEGIEESLEEVLEKVPEETEVSETPFDSDEELYEQAKRLVIKARKASASFLQRRLRIGYNRAARIIDMLEARGIVGPQQGSKPREVYVPPEEEEKGSFSEEEKKENNNFEKEKSF